MMRFRLPFCFFLLAVIAGQQVSCTRMRTGNQIAATLDNVESYINDRPDSALSVLRSVDTTALHTRALRARYSLLRVMALDKCFEDITHPGLLDPAVNWYERHGSADEKLKVLYYEGSISQSLKDLNAAAVFYYRAESYVERAKDLHAVGLLYAAEASLYNAVFNTEKELAYRQKELEVFKRNHDPMTGAALGGLALVYHSKKAWAEADSLYRESICQSDRYPKALGIYLSNYARMKLLQPEKDPVGALDLLNRKRELVGGGFTPKEAGAYAYALALTGEKSAGEHICMQLKSLSGHARYDALPWLARIAEYYGEVRTAYDYQVEMHVGEEDLIMATLSDPVNRTLQSYSEMAVLREKEKRGLLASWALAAILLLVSLVVLALLRGQRLRAELDRLLSIRTSLEQELLEQEYQNVEVSSGMSSRLQQLRILLQRERLERLRKSGRYGYWMWMERQKRYSNEEIVRLLEKDLQEICKLEKDSIALTRRLDKELDGLVTRLKGDLNFSDGSDEERLLCYWLIDLKPDMMAALLKIEVNNVYVRKHRLEKKISEHHKEEYAFLMD